MELPKIYEPIESFKALEERLKYFLDQVIASCFFFELFYLNASE